jgi:hypothetical protein
VLIKSKITNKDSPGDVELILCEDLSKGCNSVKRFDLSLLTFSVLFLPDEYNRLDGANVRLEGETQEVRRGQIRDHSSIRGCKLIT